MKGLYTTQGGGVCYFDGAHFRWHSEIPSFIDADVGDIIPDEWGTAALNQEAINEMEWLRD